VKAINQTFHSKVSWNQTKWSFNNYSRW